MSWSFLVAYQVILITVSDQDCLRTNCTVSPRPDYSMICSGYSGDDINKFLWMVRIAEGEHPNEVKEANFMSKHGHYTVDHDVSKTMKNSLMYKLSYYK